MTAEQVPSLVTTAMNVKLLSAFLLKPLLRWAHDTKNYLPEHLSITERSSQDLHNDN